MTHGAQNYMTWEHFYDSLFENYMNEDVTFYVFLQEKFPGNSVKDLDVKTPLRTVTLMTLIGEEGDKKQD